VSALPLKPEPSGETSEASSSSALRTSASAQYPPLPFSLQLVDDEPSQRAITVTPPPSPDGRASGPL
jgi:hypothetical protein